MLTLLEHGADPNLRERRFGRTALHEAAMHEHSHVVHEMSKRGADGTIRGRRGNMATHVF